MKLLITILILLIPTCIYAWLVRGVDRFEKEPPKYLFYAFCWGAVPAVILALILQIGISIPVALLVGSDTLSGELIEASIGAPVTEEFLKGLGVASIYFTRRREFDGWVDGLVYGAMAGLGFAYVENILYLMGTTSWEEWGTLFVLRTIVFGGLHAFWTAFTGIGFGLARYRHGTFAKVTVIGSGLLLAMFGHLVHNSAATLVEVTSGVSLLVALFNYLFLCGVMLVLWRVAVNVDRRRLRIYLRDEVTVSLTQAYYDALCDFSRFRNLGLNRQQQRHFVQVAAELAQKKLQLQKMGNEAGNLEEIMHLRQDLRLLCGL